MIYYFDDIIKFKDVNFDVILIDEKLDKNVLFINFYIKL